jgi:antitoxin component of MazEF toxin-antitoxin module
MVGVETRVRKWGDSMAVIIPHDVAKAERINVDDIIHLNIHKEHDLSDLFGKFKTRKTPQQLKDESRNGWE